MALVLADRVLQTGSANTTVSFNLTTAVSGYQSFAIIGNGNTTYYSAWDGTNWEVGIGTYSTTGPILTRTTIIVSSNSNAAVSTFGSVITIFVTQPAEKAVYLDINGNAFANSFTPGWTSTTTAAGTTTLTVASTYYQRFVGSTTQTLVLPDATTVSKGQGFIVDNDSTGSLALQTNGGGSLGLAVPGMAAFVFCEDNSTTVGSWSGYMFVPGGGPSGQVTWGTAGLSMGGQTITNVANITSSSDALIHGLTVGQGGGSVSTNTAVGASALVATNTGGFTTGIGNAALQNNTSGAWNSALGFGALNSNSTGSYNTSVGGYALVNNTTASNNTAVGYQAGYANTTGTANNYVGYQSGYTNTTGTTNNAFGNAAMYFNNGGSDNVAMGHVALYTNTTGASNVAIGKSALQSNTTASYNTAVGYQSLYTNTTGTGNTAIGYIAGYAITTGSYNTALGDNAMTGSSLTGSGNTNVGYNSYNSSGSVNNELVIVANGNTGGYGRGSNTGYILPGSGGMYQGNNSTSWSITSDQRLKKNIVDNTVGLTAINGIKVRNFEYRLPDEITDLDKSNAVAITGVQLGPIAQELQQVLPDCVKTESTGVMSVDSSDVLWHLVTAVQQLSAQVTALQAKVGV